MDPDSFALVVALHEQFAMVNTAGIRDYARTHNLDPATVSRSLSCAVVPTWDFIEELAHTAARDSRRRTADDATLSRLRELYSNVLASSGQKGHVVQALRADLAKAKQEALRYEETIARLSRELSEAQELNDSLTVQLKSLGWGLAQQRTTHGAAYEYNSRLYTEQSAVEDIIFHLKRQIAKERELKDLAEGRCQRLLEQLASHDQHEDTNTGAEQSAEPEPVDRPHIEDSVAAINFRHLYLVARPDVERLLVRLGASRQSAEDAAADAFAAAWQLINLEGWDSVDSWSRWVRAVAVRNLHSTGNRRNRSVLMAPEGLPEAVIPDHAEAIAQDLAVLDALDQLDDVHRAVAVLDLDDAPTWEAAEALQISEQQVRDVRKSAHDQLRRYLAAEKTTTSGRSPYNLQVR